MLPLAAAVVGGAISNRASKRAAGASTHAANLQAQAQREGIEEMRRQFDIGREDLFGAKDDAYGLLSMFKDQGLGAQGQIEQASTAGGLDSRLGAIFNGSSFKNLLSERMKSMQGAMGASGISRSGAALQEMASLPTGLGLQLEELLHGRQSGLVNRMMSVRGGLADASYQTAGAASGLASAFGQQANQSLAAIGKSQASGVLGAAQAQGQHLQNVSDLTGNVFDWISNAATGGLGGGGGGANLFFSDIRLKDDVCRIGEIVDLNIYQWDWVPEVSDMAVAKMPTIGFLSSEVRQRYPEYVATFGGFDCIAYGYLLDHLETKIEGGRCLH